ncbi:MAG: hypothetical protein ACO26G_02635 [Rickettsiales bacterium]
MKKGLIIKLAIVLIVIGLSYCVFWFFKAGQTEKQINKLIGENSNYINIGEVSVAGFPLNQKITINDLKVTIPVNLVSKKTFILKKIEASAGIFSNEFKINIVDTVKTQDNEGDMYDIEFANQPEISISLNDGFISNFKYSDGGFKVLDGEKNVVNSTKGTSFTSETSVDEADKKTSKISIALNEVEGYALIDFYKNILEKKVVEGIKTEEIKVRLSDTPNNQLIEPSSITPDLSQLPPPSGQPIGTQPGDVVIQAQPAPLANPVAQAVPAVAPPAQPQAVGGSGAPTPTEGGMPYNPNQPNVAPVGATTSVEAMRQAVVIANQVAANDPSNPQIQPPVIVDPNQPSNPTPPVVAEGGPQNIADAIIDTSIIKSNIIMDLVITLTPSIKQDEAEPVDPTQIQELPVQYVHNVKIDNFELSNPLYKINVTGDFSSSSDDNYPSGGITVKIEKIGNLIQQLSGQFQKYAQTKKPNAPAQGVEVNIEQAKSNYIQNYDVFLSNIATSLPLVAIEIASKNSVTKDNVSQFDVRREKNLEFMINEVPVREIVGKL